MELLRTRSGRCAEVLRDEQPLCSSIYAVRWGMDGVMGLQNSEIQVTEVGDLETKDAGRYRIKWYASAAVFSMLGVARVKGNLIFRGSRSPWSSTAMPPRNARNPALCSVSHPHL